MQENRPPRGGWTRRQLLEAGALGAGAAAAGALGLTPGYGLAADVPMEFDGRSFQLAAPEPNPKRGGRNGW